MLNKKGFTLIELMIVIAIIGILAAIIIPNLIAWLNGTHGGDSQVVEFASNETVIESEIVEGPVIYEAGSNCSEEGKKIIEIDGVIYHLGKVKNSWGDLEAVPCE